MVAQKHRLLGGPAKFYIEARYIGGKNVNGGKDVILMLNNIKTTNGITIEITIIKDLYFKV